MSTPYYDPDDVIPNILSEETAKDLTADTRDDPVNMAIISEVCQDASDYIDSFCSKRFVVPFDPVPKVIRRACATVIGYMLFNRRVANGLTNEFKDAFDNITKWLGMIATGKVTIDGAVKPAANKKQTGGKVSGNDRVFTDDTMKGL